MVYFASLITPLLHLRKASARDESVVDRAKAGRSEGLPNHQHLKIVGRVEGSIGETGDLWLGNVCGT
jgi:hypothetical protein